MATINPASYIADRNGNVISLQASTATSVTPNDSTVLSTTGVSLYVGTGGNLAVTTLGGNTITFTNVSAGFFPVLVTKVLSTGTTASGIISLS